MRNRAGPPLHGRLSAAETDGRNGVNMDIDVDAAFDGAFGAPVEQEIVAETPVVETPAEPVVAEPAPEQQVVEAPAPESKPEPGHVPITALLDEREKRKELERRLAALEETRQRDNAPDPIADPTGYQQHQFQIMQQALLDARLNMSETVARRHFGEDVTDKAKNWALSKFQTNPAFQAEVLGHADPYGYAIEAYQRDQIASQVTPDKFQAFLAWEAAQAQIAAAPAAPPPQVSAPPPRSIVSAPSTGGVTQSNVTPEDAFDSAFK